MLKECRYIPKPEKSGFRLEGTIRHGKMVSEYCDYNIWGLIREDIAGIREKENKQISGVDDIHKEYA